MVLDLWGLNENSANMELRKGKLFLLHSKENISILYIENYRYVCIIHADVACRFRIPRLS